jgi:L-ascorbate metabolism protein UlaG (beta-lactamase superfamily)
MKIKQLFTIITLSVLLVIAFSCAKDAASDAQSNQAQSTLNKENAKMLAGVKRLINATVRIERGRVIYFDPIGIDGKPQDADVIFITHSHSDHFSPADIAKLKKAETTLVIPESCKNQAQNLGFKEIVAVTPDINLGKVYEVKGIRFTTPPAYNARRPYHRIADQWVGYIVDLDGTSYYIAGDMDAFDGLVSHVHADVIFLPVYDTFLLSSSEAANLANLMKPKIAIPYHYGGQFGTDEDAANFISLLDKTITGVRFNINGNIVK